MRVDAAVERVGGLQTENPPSRYIGLASRLDRRSWHTFLVDVQVAGTCTNQGAAIQVEPLRRLTRGERAALADETDRMEEFLRG
jgi:hypothetical protein